MPRKTPAAVANRLRAEIVEWAGARKQGEVGKLLGISQGHAGQILNGKKTPGPEVMFGLAAAEPLRLWRALGFADDCPMPKTPRERAIEAHTMLGSDRDLVLRATLLAERGGSQALQRRLRRSPRPRHSKTRPRSRSGPRTSRRSVQRSNCNSAG